MRGLLVAHESVTDTMSLARHIASERKTMAFRQRHRAEARPQTQHQGIDSAVAQRTVHLREARGLVARQLACGESQTAPTPSCRMPEVHGDRPSRGNMCMQKPEIVEHHAAANPSSPICSSFTVSTI